MVNDLRCMRWSISRMRWNWMGQLLGQSLQQSSKLEGDVRSLWVCCWPAGCVCCIQFCSSQALPHGRAAMVELCAALDWQWGPRLDLLGKS